MSDLETRAEAAAKPLGPFDEARARDFIGLLVHRGEIIDECLATIRRLEAEGAGLRELLKAARSYIPYTPRVDEADLLADIARALGEKP